MLAIILSLALLLSFSACGAPATPAETKGTEPKESVTDTTPAEETPTEATEEVPAGEFEEIVVVDNESCTIKITGLDPENFFGYTLKAFFENKTADKTLMYSVETASVNGVSFDPFFATEVAPGKKTNEEISFTDDDLTAIIGDFTDIELNFRVYDTNNWSADDITNVSVHVYPYGEDKAVKFTREPQGTDVVLLDNEYVTMTLLNFEVDDIWGYTGNLFLVNKSDANVMFSADDVSVNGFMVDPFYAESVAAGTCAFSEISWSEDDLAENDIAVDAIETIEMTVRVYDEDDWSADDYVNEVVTINP